MITTISTELTEGLQAFLGEQVSPTQAEAHLRNATLMVKAYTRDEGFDDSGQPSEDLQAVIISAAARSIKNPTHVRQEGIGPFSQSPGTLYGWTLAELAILHRYRKRAH